MAIFKTGWLHAAGDADGEKRFAWSHVKSIFYNKAANVLLKDKLDEMDRLIDAKIAKAMMANQQVNDANKVPTSALAYTMQQAITKNAGDITQLNSDLQYTYRLQGGTEIPEGADLYSDTYKVPGNYRCSTNATVATLRNLPPEIGYAFSLKVEYVLGNDYPSQVFVSFNNNVTVRRTFDRYNKTWTSSVYVRNSDLAEYIRYENVAITIPQHASYVDVPLSYTCSWVRSALSVGGSGLTIIQASRADTKKAKIYVTPHETERQSTVCIGYSI